MAAGSNPVGETAPRRSPWWLVLRVAISAGLVALILARIDWRDSIEITRAADLRLFGLAVLLDIAGRYLAAYRWYALLHGRHPSITFRGMSRLVLTTTLLGLFMPSGGTEAMRLVAVTRATKDLALVAASMVVERVTALIALMIIVLIGVALAPLPLPAAVAPLAWLALIGLVTLSVALMLSRPRRALAAILHRLKLGGPAKRIDKLLASLESYRDRPRLLLATLGTGLLSQLMRVIPTVVIGAALGLDVPALYYLVVVPLVFFMVMLPISIGGLGVREAAMVYFLGAVGVEASAALSLSIVSYLLFLLSVLPGGWIYLRRGLGFVPR